MKKSYFYFYIPILRRIIMMCSFTNENDQLTSVSVEKNVHHDVEIEKLTIFYLDFVQHTVLFNFDTSYLPPHQLLYLALVPNSARDPGFSWNEDRDRPTCMRATGFQAIKARWPREEPGPMNG